MSASQHPWHAPLGGHMSLTSITLPGDWSFPIPPPGALPTLPAHRSSLNCLLTGSPRLFCATLDILASLPEAHWVLCASLAVPRWPPESPEWQSQPCAPLRTPPSSTTHFMPWGWLLYSDFPLALSPVLWTVALKHLWANVSPYQTSPYRNRNVAAWGWPGRDYRSSRVPELQSKTLLQKFQLLLSLVFFKGQACTIHISVYIKTKWRFQSNVYLNQACHHDHHILEYSGLFFFPIKNYLYHVFIGSTNI